MPTLITLSHALTTAEEALAEAVQFARELSGEAAGRAAGERVERDECLSCSGAGTTSSLGSDSPWIGWSRCPDCNGRGYYETRRSDPGEPASPGTPCLVELAARLDDVLARFRGAIGDEVKGMIAGAEGDKV